MTDLPQTSPEPAEAAAAERGISPIAGRLGFGRGGKAATVAALAAGCAVFMFATAKHPRARASEPPTPARQVVPYEPAASVPTLAHPGPDAPTLTPAVEGAQPNGYVVPALAPGGGPAPAATPPPDAPVLVFSRAAGQPEVVAPPAIPVAATRPASPIGLSRATRLPNRDFLILAGTSIPCILQTAMDTSTPGYVSCVTPADVYSETGSVVLLEKGTKVLGEYRGGLKAGQGRLFVVWTRAVTPGGVAVSLASPAADALGRAGLDGDIDSHFWRRFGGAVLLSVIDGGLGALGHSGATVSFQAPSTAATAALQGAAEIAPTLRKAPGAQVSIFAAQDFDFSGVYGLKGR